MDDYDVRYKELSLSLFRHILVSNMPAADVRLSGVGLLVWKVNRSYAFDF